jgi:hypothetical protein
MARIGHTFNVLASRVIGFGAVLSFIARAGGILLTRAARLTGAALIPVGMSRTLNYTNNSI